MNKKIAIAGASLFVLGAAHTGFWFYESGKIKLSIEQAAGQISKEIGRKNTEFFYSSSSISGYPFNFTVTVAQPKFVTAGGGEKLEITSGDEKLVVISNLIGSGYKIKFPAKLDIKQTIDDKDNSYKLEFTKEAPQIEAKFAGNLLFGMKDGQELIPYLSEKLRSLRYSDSGYTLVDAADGTKISYSEADMIQVTKSLGKTNSISTAYNIKLQNIDASALFGAEKRSGTNVTPDSAVWPITSSMDLSSIDSRDESGKSSSFEVVLRDVDVKAKTFGFGVKGNVKANGNDIFPFGDLSVKIDGYAGMVDYFHGVVSDALAKTNIPLFHIKSEKSIDFKKVLYEIASEKSNEGKDILLTISREQGKSLFVGQKGLMEVIDLLKNSASGDAEAQKKDSVTQPKAPVIDLSPAPGLPGVGAPVVVPHAK